jgi:hypothetical protein
MSFAELIDAYMAGPELLQNAVAGMAAAEFDARPVPGKWSTREVICHIADFEPVYADRMKRVIAEHEPTMFSGDPDLFAKSLAYGVRDLANELVMIAAIRRHVGEILRTLPEEAFARVGQHSEAGPLTLETLLRNVTKHIPHHVQFIEEKREVLAKNHLQEVENWSE